MREVDSLHPFYRYNCERIKNIHGQFPKLQRSLYGPALLREMPIQSKYRIDNDFVDGNGDNKSELINKERRIEARMG